MKKDRLPILLLSIILLSVLFSLLGPYTYFEIKRRHYKRKLYSSDLREFENGVKGLLNSGEKGKRCIVEFIQNHPSNWGSIEDGIVIKIAPVNVVLHWGDEIEMEYYVMNISSNTKRFVVPRRFNWKIDGPETFKYTQGGSSSSGLPHDKQFPEVFDIEPGEIRKIRLLQFEYKGTHFRAWTDMGGSRNYFGIPIRKPPLDFWIAIGRGIKINCPVLQSNWVHCRCTVQSK
jgi:hypothetical protein